MEYIFGAVTIAAITFLGAMSPGPDFAVVIRNNLVRSRKAGIATAFGIGLGLSFYVTLALLGLAAIIASSVVIFTVMKYLGAAYLLYLGITFLRAKPQNLNTEFEQKKPESLLKSIQEGFLTNFSNPKAIVFLLAVFTQVISPETPILVQALYGLIIPIVAFSWFVILSFILTTPTVRTRISKFLHRIEQAMGVLLIGLGIKIALDSN